MFQGQDKPANFRKADNQQFTFVFFNEKMIDQNKLLEFKLAVSPCNAEYFLNGGGQD